MAITNIFDIAGSGMSAESVRLNTVASNPLADANGYVYSSNVNTVDQMADMISASRSYQNDADVLNTSKQLMLDTLKLGQS